MCRSFEFGFKVVQWKPFQDEFLTQLSISSPCNILSYLIISHFSFDDKI